MSAPADRTTRRCAKFFLLLRGRQGRHRPGKLPLLQSFLPAAFCLRDERELCPADRGSPRADLAHKISEVTVGQVRSEEHTSELQSLTNLVCRLLLEKKNIKERTT